MSIIIQENVPLAPLTTFQIGGSARYFAEARSEDDIRMCITAAGERKVPLIVLSGGSNVLVADIGLDAFVLHIVTDECSIKGRVVEAEGGINLLSLIKKTSQAGIGGWEKLAGIPGTLGGAVRGNAGAFGTEIKDVVLRVRALNSKTGGVKDFLNTECEFSYRHSFFKDHSEWIILNGTFELQNADVARSLELIEGTIQEREKRHLQNIQAAGSYFMNPVAPRAVQEMFEKEKNMKSREGRVPAGWLIEKAGMKGATVGGAIASLQHPNYIVNTGNATALDVRNLAEKVKQAVKKEFGIELEEEAVVLVV
ncbi:MAG: UDP-N-acetylmuramate dehydrogenase [bacterium]|nr:UDP-N-acetylmuramate dehydrogenase [bacterium]